MKIKIDCAGIFVQILVILFIGLKLLGVIDWSWWWVLSPIWISIILFVVVILGIYTILEYGGK